MHIDYDAEIIPGASLGGISLNDSIYQVLECLDSSSIAYDTETFTNFGYVFDRVIINQGTIGVTANEQGDVIGLWCSEGYTGGFDGRLYAGMTISKILERTKKQMCINGRLVLDAEYGLFYDIPEKYHGEYYDDIDHVSDLPIYMVLSDLHIADRNWWWGR